MSRWQRFLAWCRAFVRLAEVGEVLEALPQVRTRPSRESGAEHGGPVGLGQSRFVVARAIGAKAWTLYDGPNGGEAARWFLHVQRHREPGTMTFTHDGQLRDWYPRET